MEARTPDPIVSPVVVEPIVTAEKLGQLLRLQTEYPELDFKQSLDLRDKKDLVELAKDLGAMQVLGGYVVIGADDHGTPTGSLDPTLEGLFDEAALRPKLQRYLPEPLELRTNVIPIDGHRLVLIYVGPHPTGCAFFRIDGVYPNPRGGGDIVRFRAGEAFWRNGTSSERLSQAGFAAIIERRLAVARNAWLAEQQLLLRDQIAELQEGYSARRVAQSPLGAVSFELDADTLVAAAVELVRTGDRIPLLRLFAEAERLTRQHYADDDFEPALTDLVDKLVCLAAAFLQYEEPAWFDRALDALTKVYNVGFPSDVKRLEYATRLDPQEKAPRLWLLSIERIYALGALAVRLKQWTAVRKLTLARPEHLPDFYSSWLRHAVTMASRADRLQEERDGQTYRLHLLSLARTHIDRLPWLRPDGVDEDASLTSLASFDLLSILATIADANEIDSRLFYTNFAGFYAWRIEPALRRLLTDDEMRKILFPLDDAFLAEAIRVVQRYASGEHFLTGFHGFEDRFIIDWLDKHRQPSPPT